MSNHLNLFLGAYLVVPNVPRTRPSNSKICSGDCGVSAISGAAARFCPSCGAVLIAAPPVSAMGLLRCEHVKSGSYEEDFFIPESSMTTTHCVWLPNRMDQGQFISESTPCEATSLAGLELTSEAVAKFKSDLLANFPTLVADIQEEFGVVAELKVGLVPYWA